MRLRRTGGKCFNCRKAVGREDYCYGCKAFVCLDCMEPSLLQTVFMDGTHKPDDHLYRIVRVPRGPIKLPKGCVIITDDDC